jgi:hypothetical protein
MKTNGDKGSQASQQLLNQASTSQDWSRKPDKIGVGACLAANNGFCHMREDKKGAFGCPREKDSLYCTNFKAHEKLYKGKTLNSAVYRDVATSRARWGKNAPR